MRHYPQLGGFRVIQGDDPALAHRCGSACGWPTEVRPFDDRSRE